VLSGAASGERYEFTSQLFFPETVTDLVHTVLNEGDGIYLAGGDQLVLSLAEADDGWVGTYDIGLYTEPS
jgi:hypothetical protein